MLYRDNWLLLILFLINKLAIGQDCSYKEKCNQGEPDMVNIHIVSHSHNDAGWLKTVDEYYIGTKKYIDKAGVQYILDSVVESLEQDPSRKFSYVEGAFMYRWLTGRSDFDRHRISRLVQYGQLEILSGGWVMNDEACTHYADIINQMSLGFKIYKDAFGACGTPRTGWQIDPFGHSAAYASLLAAMGFDGLFFGRVSDSVKVARFSSHQLEFLWHPLPNAPQLHRDGNLLPNGVGSTLSPNFSNSSVANEMFVSILPNVYWPPPGFCFDIFCDDDPIQDNDVENGYNKPERINAFLLEMERQAKLYDTNHIIVTMGNDFNYQSADNWYRNLDKLIRYVNEQRSLNGSSLQFNAFYSTPGCYLYALNNAKSGGPGSLKRRRQARRRLLTNNLGTTTPSIYPHYWPETTGSDFFPLINAPNMIWTGYYTSRPTLKGMIRDSSRFLQVCKQIDVLALLQPRRHDIRQLERAVALAQHHDAVTGTAKQAVTYDYMERLAYGREECKAAIQEGLKKLSVIGKKEHLKFCPLLNISSCPFTQNHAEFDVIIYNPVGWRIDTYVSVPVRKDGLTVSDLNQSTVPFQIIPLPRSLSRIPERRADLNQTLGSHQPHRDHVLTFPVTVPALGVARYTVRTSNSVGKGWRTPLRSETRSSPPKFPGSNMTADIESNSIQQPAFYHDDWVRGGDNEGLDTDTDNEDYYIENEFLRLEFDPSTNHVSRLINKKSGIATALNQSFGYYGVPLKSGSSSGAYVFRSHDLVPNDLSKYASRTTLKFVKGPVLQQARQRFAPWVDQEVTLYPGVPAVQFTWTVGPIPINDTVPKDVVTRFESDLDSGSGPTGDLNHFYTDSNGRFVVARQLSLDPKQRRANAFVARNYYPATARLYIKDEHHPIDDILSTYPLGVSMSVTEFRQLGIIVDRAQGGTSPDRGMLELMVHRRLLEDDNLGVGEPLNERGIDGDGLIARGSHWLVFDTPTECDRIMTKMAQTEYLRPQVMFAAPQPKPPVIPYGGQFLVNPLPPNLHLLSLAQWERSILLRLEHIYEPGKHPTLSLPVTIDLTKIFATFSIVKITEMSLGANQLLSDVKRFKWPIEAASQPFTPTEGFQASDNSTVIELGPLDIRTFLLKFEG